MGQRERHAEPDRPGIPSGLIDIPTPDYLPEFPSIGARMRFVRERAGLSREALRRLMSTEGAIRCSVMTIRRNESGVRTPGTDEVLALATLTDTSAAWILSGGAEEDRTPKQARAFVIARIQAELARRALDPMPRRSQRAFERVEAVLAAARRQGRLPPGTWSYWLAVREGAVLSGGYVPPTR